MARYELKTWTEPFQAIWEGACTHTIRRWARPYAAGDTLLLREYDPRRPQHHVEDRYTGRSLVVRVTYLSPPGSFGLPDELCVMSIQLADCHHLMSPPGRSHAGSAGGGGPRR